MDKERVKRKEQLKVLLQDKRYRDAFVSEYIDAGISFQIRALRKKKNLTQKGLANLTGMAQERISVAENPNYSRFNIKTLKRIASAFDVAFIGRFVPIGELVHWELNLSSETLAPVSFEEDPYFKPQAIIIPAQSGALAGSSMSLESPGIQKELPEIENKATLYYLDPKQKKLTEDKMDEYQGKRYAIL